MTDSNETIERFLDAQEHSYGRALEEIEAGRKRSHWMWYIFPQLRGLGMSEMSWRYGIDGAEEAREYMKDSVLGERLKSISRAVLLHKDKSASDIFGYIDDMKLRSCMTLFEQVSDDPVFGEVLDAFYDGERDQVTLKMLAEDER